MKSANNTQQTSEHLSPKGGHGHQRIDVGGIPLTCMSRVPDLNKSEAPDL